MSSIAWEPILATLKYHYTICMVSLLHQLYKATISPYVSDDSHIPHHCLLLQLMSCHCHLIGQFVNSVSTLPHIPHLLTSVPHIHRCCHHALCPQESNHRRDIFTPSHFDSSYQYPAKTIPNTLPFLHSLHCTQSRQDIQIA